MQGENKWNTEKNQKDIMKQQWREKEKKVNFQLYDNVILQSEESRVFSTRSDRQKTVW